MSYIDLPTPQGRLESYNLVGMPLVVRPPGKVFNRVVYAAAHVVADPFAATEPSGLAAIDWARTIAYRRHLLGLGLGVAEAMDTAQRGMGLGWAEALELIGRTLAETRDIDGALIVSGCGTDHLASADVTTMEDVVRAYDQQMNAIQKLGGSLILMASRALVRVAAGPEDYRRVYRRVLANAERKVVLHWLGDMFDPQLSGYWGAPDFDTALMVCCDIIGENQGRIDGIKVSLLDDAKEIRMRRMLPAGVKMYTGDDFNYPALIEGDAQGFSHALLGIFDPIAPAASAALVALAAGDRQRFHDILDPTVALSRLIFRAPTQYYKTGVVFLAYLNGHQDHFVMVGGQQALRPLPYFTAIFKLADQAGLLGDPHDAAARMRRFLGLYGL